MSVLALHDDGYLRFDEEECRAAGRARADEYQNAQPYPHIVIDDLLDKDVLRYVAANYPSLESKTFFDRDQERFKFQFPAQEIPNGRTRNLLAELNSQAFLAFLEEMTGIKGLMPDPYFTGGGLHLTKRGGHLSVHADFNIHEKLKVERRLNLLVYLNDDWLPEYKGELEIWDKKMTQCERTVAPLIGRAVVFNTNADSFHGHPDPLACPPDRDRRSIATYYYTAMADGLTATPARTTTFKPRPNSVDAEDRRIKVNHFIGDWVPPRLQGVARQMNPFK